MEIRRFREENAEEVSALIAQTIQVTNSRDYPPEHIERLVGKMSPEFVLERASWTHFYVAWEGGQIVGCGAVGPYWDSVDESSLFTIFVAPDCQGKGIGRAIVETLEKDEFALRAKRIEIAASITGEPFYRKLGYTRKNGMTEPDGEGLFRMEKFRRVATGEPPFGRAQT